MSEIFVGIDGGGTHTRAIAVTRAGEIVGRSLAGGSNPAFDSRARQNTQLAIEQVVAAAGHDYSQVARLVGGIAGVNQQSDRRWGEQHLSPEGLSCPRTLVNDSVIAHVGAFQSQPGIIVIAGTGSIVLGINEAMDPIRNFDFRHWAGASASHISYQLVHRLMSRPVLPADAALAESVTTHWEVADMKALRALGSKGFLSNSTECNTNFSLFAPKLTAAADSGSSLAQQVCREAARSLCVGVRLVASRFSRPKIDVALAGGVACSEFIRDAVQAELSADAEYDFRISEPAFSPEVGAAMMALKNHGIAVDGTVVENLASTEAQTV